MRRRAVPALLALLLAAACTGQDEDRELTVLAAASLTEPFTDLAERFEADHPGVEVRVGFDSSATIAAQVAAGAPADVVATADPWTMRRMAGVVDPPSTFARNQLTLVVPPDNPADVRGIGDLERAEYVACTAAAPCGRLAAGVLDQARITRRPRSLEVDVKAVLTKVVLGEADAGLVYVSDAHAAGSRVREVPLPEGADAATSYPIAVVGDSARRDLAEAWVDLVRSAAGRRVLARAGFAVDEELR